MYAAAWGKMPSLVGVLLDAKAEIEARDYEGRVCVRVLCLSLFCLCVSLSI